MGGESFSDRDAQAVRTQWFRYLDTIEPARAALHGYCLKLARNIWDAEDLLQDVLLRGFAMTARGDLHGEASPVANMRAYLFRVATHLWIDVQRKARFEARGEAPEATVEPGDPVELREAIDQALRLSSPQEFAAFVLREGYDFSASEIADFVGTSEGTVKSALSRARRKLATSVVEPAQKGNPQLTRALAEAMNSGDMEQVKALLSETLNIVVCNVGGGRGRDGVWTEKSIPGVVATSAECDGCPILVFTSERTGRVTDFVRVEGDRLVNRLTDYCYAPETLAYVAGSLGLEVQTIGYHQPPETLVEMIATTALPWR